jgi:Ca-activated chloride channel family protein
MISKASRWILVASLLSSFVWAAACQSAFAQRVSRGSGDPSLQGGTQSTSLQAGTQSTSLQAGAQSTMLQSSTQSTTVRGGTEGALIQGGVEHETGPLNILILLDCSYSMKEKISGTAKMACAKRVLEEAMSRIPSDVNVGLRVFGQQHSMMIDMDCRATALLVPLGTGNRGSIIREVRQLEPNGMTPLTFALEQAAGDDFRGVQGRKTIILISDGMDTCGQDPCRFITILPSFGIKIKINVVGVDLKKEPGARNELNCIADKSGGKYYDANTAAQLIDSISASVNEAITGRVMTGGSSAKNTETPPELIPMTPMQPMQKLVPVPNQQP